MSSTPHTETATLISAVRKQLWLQQITRTIKRDSHISSAILLSGGLYHLLVQPLQPIVIITLALLPLVLRLLQTLIFKRPGVSDAAHAADSWFNGKNLITSAWELHERGAARPATTELILLRAERSAAQWRKQIATVQPLRWPAMTLPLIVALTGLFLLQLPSKELFAPALTLKDKRVTVNHSINTADVANNRQAPDLTPTESESASRNTPPPHTATTATEQNRAPQQSAQSDEMDGENSNRETLPPSMLTAVASANDGGNQAGDQEGLRADRGINSEVVTMQISEIEIRRMAGSEGASDAASELNSTAVPQQQLQPQASLIPAAQQLQTPYRGHYTPALKAYMARYFLELNAEEKQP